METVSHSVLEEVDNLRAQFINTVEQGKVIFLVMDSEGRIDYISKYVDDILHYKQRDLIKGSIFNITEPESLPLLRGVIREAQQTPAVPQYFEGLGLHCTYCYKHYFDGLMVAKDFQRGQRFVVYLHDVTQRKVESEKLSLINLELDSFIYKASHDLRAPLTSLTGLLNLMDRTENMEDTREYSALMRRSMDRLDKFISQLAHYSRNNNTGVDIARINFKELLTGVIENYKFLPKAEKIRFQIDMDEAPEVCSDSFRIKIILNNLVSNAIKYHNLFQYAPFIKLKVTGDNKEFSISVIDNGSGIEEKYIEKIFGMFQRATEGGQGSGLGLYIVKKALDKIDGKINVASDFGSGSTFSITVPNRIDHCKVEDKVLLRQAV